MISYGGNDLPLAILKGDFPLVVLLWGMARAHDVDVYAPDIHGHTILHFAMLGPSLEVLQFILFPPPQQCLINLSIISALNESGESAFLRAGSSGMLTNVHFFLQAIATLPESDVQRILVQQDLNGHSALTHSLRYGHVWMTHYLIANVSGTTSEPENFLHAIRSSNPKVLDLLLRFHPSLVRKWISQFVDDEESESQTALELLVEKDRAGSLEAALAIGAWKSHLVLKATKLAKTFRKTQCYQVLKRHSYNPHNDQPMIFAAANASLFQQNVSKTRLWVVLAYSLVVLMLLLPFVFAPWYMLYPVLLGLVLLYTLYKKFSPHSHSHHRSSGSLEPRIEKTRSLTDSPPKVTPIKRKHWKSKIHQPEWAAGVWLGWVLAYIGYLIALYIKDDWEEFRESNSSEILAIVVIMSLTVLMWVLLCLLRVNPGRIETAEKDIPEMLAYVARHGAIPSALKTCTTCCISKPIRSKHCRNCGVCIARHDHHCVWLNSCIGASNHKLFLTFLLLHVIVMLQWVVLLSKMLHDSIPYESSFRAAVEGIFDDFLPAVVLVFWAGICFFALSVLLIKMLFNVTRNITENENINWKRYEYLTAVEGEETVFRNKFDKGALSNIKEFFSVPGYAVEYFTLYSVPTPGASNGDAASLRDLI